MSFADFQEDEAKQLSREYNLKQVQSVPSLWNAHQRRLRHDWLELPGIGAPTLQMLRSRHHLGPGRFIGVERDPEVHKGLVSKYGQESQDHRFAHASLHQWLRGGGSLRVGVCNWDGWVLGKDTQKFREQLGQLWAFAHSQRKRIGGFVLILNMEILQRGSGLEHIVGVLKDCVGHVVEPAHLEQPGVLYGADREGRKSKRLNYAIRFGNVRREK